ncbi:MAG: serine/threonine-protein phosphatase [Treponemataceae bacterium]|nr:serine/threonine-protein phosphatase [Treponemataceae bacterium]
MIYIILNAILVPVLLWFSSVADIRNDTLRFRSVVNSILVLAIIALTDAVSLLVCQYGNIQFGTLTSKLMFFLTLVFSSMYCTYLMNFPASKKSAFFNVLNILLILFAVYGVFGKITRITVSVSDGVQYSFDPVAEGGALSWFNLLQIGYLMVLPAFGVLSLFLRFQAMKNKLNRQKMILFMVSVLACWGLMYLMTQQAVRYNKAFSSMYPLALALLVFLSYQIVIQEDRIDAKVVVERFIDLVVNYLLISVIAGVIFALMQPLRKANLGLFVVIFSVITIGLYTASHYIAKALNARRRNASTRYYAANFEKQLAGLDYNEEIEVLNEKILRIFKDNVRTEVLEILVEEKEGNLKTLYSSRQRAVTIPANSPIFDAALNDKRDVIFRSHAETRHRLAMARDELTKLFDSTQTEVLILLHEGRHVFGAILLGEKRLGNAYTDYDYTVFNRLYSHFFVIGYYLQNIANESVVGTVNREIQMSGQIIQSIQENMDFIRSPKVDVGYISMAAHNLGGEYYDFIRLTDERHIIVLGDISGKGINASMSTVILKSVVRTFLAETHDFKQLVQKTNAFIRNNLPKGTFLAAVFMLIDFSDNTLYYINCGIPALFMYNQAYNNVIEIQGEGRVLGFVKNIEKLVHVKKIKLNPGDIVLATTDGLLNTKSIRGEDFGRDRVQRSILENISFPASKMSEFLYNELVDFTSRELEDDVSVITIKCLSNK